MKRIKYLLMFMLPAVSVALACQNTATNQHALKGTITNAANLQVLLEQVYFDPNAAPIAVGRATCDASGNFAINQEKAFEKGLYRLTIGAKRMFFMLGGDESTVSFTGDLNSIDRLQVEITGSETFSCYANLVKEMMQGGQLTPEAAQGFAKKGCNPLMRAFYGTTIRPQCRIFVDDFKAASTALNQDMPGSKYAVDFTNMVDGLDRQLKQQEAGPIQVGQPAPEISLPGPDGKTRSLSSLKEKLYYSTFGQLVPALPDGQSARSGSVQQVQGKGFDVFSVSLDRPGAKDAWVAAIKQDGLVWDNHVSDLQFWNSAPAATYGVRSIPQTFLIDRNGNIAAVNPRNNLEQELLKVLN